MTSVSFERVDLESSVRFSSLSQSTCSSTDEIFVV